MATATPTPLTLADTAVHQGRCYYSSDHGHSFTAGASVAAPANYVRAAYDHAGHLWMATNGGIVRSSDGCATVVAVPGFASARSVALGAPAVAGGYPAVYVYGTIASDTGNPGLYRSDNEGASWVRLNDWAHGLGYVMFVQADSKAYGRVYVATNGRGIMLGEIAA